MTDHKRSKHVTGNAGLYLVCHKLSMLGWSVMNTARNARGVDVFITNVSGTRTYTVQVKALSARNATTIGKTSQDMSADYLIVCADLDKKQGPSLYAATRTRVRHCLTRDNGTRPRDHTMWLDPFRYRSFDSIETVVGHGFD
jgi:hypothetical protein